MRALLISLALCLLAAPAHAVRCGTLFADTPIISTELADDECAERANFQESGKRLRIYDASRFGFNGQPWHVRITREAMEAAVRFYAALVQVPSVTIIYGGGAASSAAVDDGSAILGETLTKIFGDTCVLYITDTNFAGGYGTGISESSVKLSIAHELFHCVQYYNWERKVSGAIWNSAAWWAEGTAEYFAHAVFPSEPPSERRAPAFDGVIASGGLLDILHANVIFFSFYAQEAGGPRGVIQFIERMSEELGMDAQMAAGASVPGIADLFQRFAQHYLDRSLRAPGGQIFDVNPDFGTAERVADPVEKSIRVKPWSIRARSYTFARGENWRITQISAEGTAQSRFRYQETRGAWNASPFEVTACAGDRIVIASPTATESTSGEKQIRFKFEERLATDQVCACPLGNWTVSRDDINNNYAMAAATSDMDPRDGPWKLRLADGAPSLEFRSDGTATYQHSLRFEGQRRPRKVPAICNSEACLRGCSTGRYTREACSAKRQTWVNMRVEDNLVVQWTWRRRDNMLLRTITQVSGERTVYNYDGFSWKLVKEHGLKPAQPSQSGNPFQCAGNQLLIQNTPASGAVSDIDSLIATLESGNAQQRAAADQLRAMRDRSGSDPAAREAMDRMAQGEGSNKMAYPFTGRFVR